MSIFDQDKQTPLLIHDGMMFGSFWYYMQRSEIEYFDSDICVVKYKILNRSYRSGFIHCNIKIYPKHNILSAYIYKGTEILYHKDFDITTMEELEDILIMMRNKTKEYGRIIEST